MEVVLDPVEQRVLGSLLEKERTVPDTYPMTLNGVRQACNQTSGRDPVLTLAELDVLMALDRLKAAGLTRVLHASHGARVPKHRQVLDERLALNDAERAVITLLLLRGPQTPGELRSRAERLHAFADRAEVETALAGLAAREEPLVAELPRRPGQKESRWRHRLGPAPAEEVTEGAATDPELDPTEVVLAEGVAARDQRVLSTYAAVAGRYADQLVDELQGKPFDRWLLERLADLAADGPVADVGCGPGHVAGHLAMAGAAVSGFDLSPAMVDEARRRFPELTFEVADLRRLPPPDQGEGWAVITAWYALVHLAASELPSATESLAQRLRPGGWLAVAIHEGSEARHLDEWLDTPVDVDFTLHRRADVVAAFAAAGLQDIEWYLRNPSSPTEAPTERVYVLGRRMG